MELRGLGFFTHKIATGCFNSNSGDPPAYRILREGHRPFLLGGLEERLPLPLPGLYTRFFDYSPRLMGVILPPLMPIVTSRSSPSADRS